MQARVTIQNYHQYRHVDKPGWKIGWTWADNEIILSMSGAFATEQGNCSDFKFQSPHSCKKHPVIVDLGPYASPQNMTDACCRGGILSSYAINPANSFSSFEVTVGNLGMNASGHAPQNLTLWAPGPGYTCGLLKDVDPTVFLDIGGRRQVQVFSKVFMPSSRPQLLHSQKENYQTFDNEICMQGHGNQHALTLLSWQTRHLCVVFHFQHFTIPKSHRAPSVAVVAEMQTKLQLHA